MYDALDNDGGDVALMLSALPRVEAPKNFEFRVKARIAEGSAPRSALFPFLKIAAPLALVLLIGAFVIFYGLLPGQADVPIVADTAQSEPLRPEPKSDLPVPPAQSVAGPQIDQTHSALPDEPYVAAVKPTVVRRAAAPEVVKPSQGGSRDFSLNSAQPKLPPGFESVEPRNLNANGSSSAADVPVRNVLGILGIAAEYGNGGWKVQSVVEKSVAARAGVRASDVIEAIDGQPLKSDSLLKGGAKVFTVRRDGKQMSLSLAN
jgi:membrane-associated protease RseP (regulator of RpoE activity)